VGRSSGRNAQNVKTRDGKGMQYFALPDALKSLRNGVNVFAIEAHNSSADKVEFFVNPSVIIED
jgi:hypothetical protein